MLDNVDQQPYRKRLVVANFFPAFQPPSSGGEQRYYHLYDRISRCFDVSLVSTTYSDRDEELIEHTSSFREYRIPKAPESDQIHWQLDQLGIGPECSGFVVALCGALESAYGKRLRELIRSADAVIHESPFTVPYDHGMGRDGIPRVYNSYNIEADLARQMMRGKAGSDAAGFIEELEGHLLSHCALVFATSCDERESFRQHYGIDRSILHLAPNGYDEAAAPEFVSSERPQSNLVAFVGSGHPPNVEALGFIAAQLAPACKHLQFDVLGSVCSAYKGAVPNNLNLRGFVSAQEKTALLSSCAAAINPIFSGAGTNLKMLDYMAHGAPIVTTKVGARGLDLICNEHVVIANADTFAKELATLVSDRVRATNLGRSARELAQERYTWRSIGESVAAVLQQLLTASSGLMCRRRLLSVSDYPVDSMSGGGQVRIRHLLAELGREFDVTLLCLTDETENSEQALAPGVVQKAFAKTAAHRLEQQRMAEGEWISVADIVSARHCLDNPKFCAAFGGELKRADSVVFEQCFVAPLLELVPAHLPVVYSSQNHEVALKQSLLSQRRDGCQLLTEVEALEARMLDAADLAVCVSANDAVSFKKLHPKISTIVVENGVLVPPPKVARYAATFGAPLAVFIGSGHPPNVEAVRFIVGTLAPATPQFYYGIVGSVCSAFDPGGLPVNVLMLGSLSDAEKSVLLGAADIAVNPMFDGGGSSLKIPDFFAGGLPVVSSKIGVRGYPVYDGVHFLEADAKNFADVVVKLIADSQLQKRLSANAWRLVRRDFDWRVLGGKLRRSLRNLPPRQARRKRLLVLTYRFGEPPRGGAETYLSKVLEQIETDRWDITIAATAVGAIQNSLMFSAMYAPQSSDEGIPEWAHDVHLFPVDARGEFVLKDCRRLHAMWMAESRVLGRRFLNEFPDAALAGGWNPCESMADGRVARWSSKVSQLRAPSDTGELRLAINALQPVRIELTQQGAPLATRDVRGQMNLQFELAPGGGLLELKCSSLYESAEDPREIGVLVTAVQFSGADKIVHVDLRDEIDQLAHRVPLDRWLRALADIVDARGPADDALFLRVRGPHSSALRTWLELNIKNYDVVLAQGVPFASSVFGVESARRAGVPVVVLPHYHMEDRYYHWQSFYDAFRGADRVIAAPNASVSAFFDPVGANAKALPGGGVTLSEFDPDALALCRNEFRQQYVKKRPFVLVLGRKADGKNYQTVLEAQRRLRDEGVVLDLVMIGPDDDGVPVRGAGVSYLGPQSRQVVVGALVEALCLVTMSESESFGIVLLEAWLAGTPVIAASTCAAFRELVVDQVNGRLVDSIADLVHALREYFVSPNLADEHALCGKKAAQRYAWGEIAKAFETELLDVCSIGSEC